MIPGSTSSRLSRMSNSFALRPSRVSEVKTHTAGGFQRLRDLVVYLLRVDSRPHPKAIVAHPNDLHRRATCTAVSGMAESRMSMVINSLP
jgi:hypothetical protein